ncbi:MAG: LacI family transcriptional regulator [Gammaproteobacteria bacterium]|nr:LacI family transcriptional regulator [Gammaproteobacteria bacterium]
MVTIKEVSELAGVSQATVSRVMNNSDKVTDKTRAAVEHAMQQLGYRPNSIAQSLASNRSNSVGVLVSELIGPFYGPMMAGIEHELRQAHKHVIIAAGHSSEADELESIEFLISRRCDALILHVEAVSDEYLINLCRGSLPVILLNRHIEEIADHCISLNNKIGGYLATYELILQGHRKIACITGPMWKIDAKDRFVGYQQALNEAGIPVQQDLVVEGDFNELSGNVGMGKLLQQHPDLTAVFCSNDQMASGAIDQLRQQGRSIPEQVSIIGYDDATFAYYLYPKLSTVHYPVKDMGEMAAHWVLSKVYQLKIRSLKLVFEPYLVLRDSIATQS